MGLAFRDGITPEKRNPGIVEEYGMSRFEYGLWKRANERKEKWRRRSENEKG
jgi:hypothetical protein